MNYEIKNLWWVETILADMPDSNSTTVLILVKAWSIYETAQTNGISHFLEHMFFKGWKKYTNPKIVAETIDEIWWEFNAFTWEEYAWYYVKSSPEHVNISIDVLWDMLVDAQFPKDELEREKWVIIQEYMMYEDMPRELAMEKFKRFYYGDNSFGWSTLGTVENIKSFNQDHFFSHKNSLYTKDNLVVIVAWKIVDSKALEQLIWETFKDLPSATSYPKPVFLNQKPSLKSDFFDKKTQQNHLVIWAKWFDMFDDQRYASNILWTILWWNMSSRLFQEIREKRGLCYYISSFHDSSFHDWVFYIRAWIEKDRFDYGLKSIYQQLEDIAKGNFSQEDFDKAVWYFTWIRQINLETSDQIAWFVWHQYLFKKEIESLPSLLDNYRKLTLDDVKSVANIIKDDNLYLYYIS